MKREDAENYAKEIQKAIGNAKTTYTAIASHIEQTWVVRMYYENGNYHREKLFKTESELIYFLIAYASSKAIKIK